MNRIKSIAFASALIGFFAFAQAQAASDDCIDSGLKATQESMHGAGSAVIASEHKSERKLTSGERDYIWTITHVNR
ncbi:hypothetical protein [Marinobacterium lutimaris]|uniref:Uncharacterized protein n=1 Tax=Marinobacterium lutimaris TaxID=568106 RepID=A0A1H5X1W4_9GAMM|nr:hypothetical protein [Marinobacterium lutimaris]SEG05802.1 hypothetical protein SAMN05444390_1011239 [Marinobacterium lutimaris]